MPKWGLTEQERQLSPWGLSPALLAPAKTTTDPVHSDVYLTVLEQLIVDSPPMQRLRRVRQLGTSHLVYQGATHSRFSHALGTLRAAQDLLDAVADNANGPRPPRNHLLKSWALAERERNWAEATVLARLGALMHDLCHVPFGHTIEDDLHVLDPHDGNAPRFEHLWEGLSPRAISAIDADPALRMNLRRLILSKETPPEGFSPRYPFVEDIVGNTICADLMDYLSRDHLNTGLPMDVGVRFINSFYVSPPGRRLHAERMVIKLDRNGHVRTDIVDEITKYLRYRYEESERVLFHHAKVAADAMIGKMLEMWRDSLWVQQARASDGTLDTNASPSLAKSRVSEARALEIEEKIKADLETTFLTRSDDGLLEHLVELGDASVDSKLRAVSKLASRILNRELYKPIGTAEGEAARSNAEAFHREFGDAARRREVEIEAAAFAGVDPAWQLVLWLPDPRMRFKVAEVLVEKKGSISHLANIVEGRDARRLVKKHADLWSISLYASEEIRHQDDLVEEILCSLQSQMNIVFRTWKGDEIATIEKIISRRMVAHGLIAFEAAPEVEALYSSVPAGERVGLTFQQIAKDLVSLARDAKLTVSGKRTPARI